jgi:hypothetical protein
LEADVAGQIAVLVPAAVQDLHDSRAALDETAGQDGAGGKAAGL